MEGISKEMLLALQASIFARDKGREDELRLLTALIDSCKELNPWLPIENAPWNKPLLAYYPTMEEGLRTRTITRRVNWDSSLHKPTHYQELQPDPK